MLSPFAIKNKQISFEGLKREALNAYTPISVFCKYAQRYFAAKHKKPLWIDKTFSDAVIISVYNGWITASMGLCKEMYAWKAFRMQLHFAYRYAQEVIGATTLSLPSRNPPCSFPGNGNGKEQGTENENERTVPFRERKERRK